MHEDEEEAVLLPLLSFDIPFAFLSDREVPIRLVCEECLPFASEVLQACLTLVFEAILDSEVGVHHQGWDTPSHPAPHHPVFVHLSCAGAQE